MIYGIKLLFPILLLWALSLVPMRVLLRHQLDAFEVRKTMNVIFMFTVVTFLSYRAEIFFFTAAIALLIGRNVLGGDARAKISVYWMAVILFPAFDVELSGAAINHITHLDHFRIAALLLLLPVAFQLALARDKQVRRPIRWLDVAVFCYPVVTILDLYPHVPLTTVIRSIVELLLDTALPYYVMTRGIRNWADLKFVLTRLLIAGIFAAGVALLEAVVRKNIYAELQWVYQVKWSLTHTLMRGSMLRVMSMTPQPIILAVQLLFTLGLWISMSGKDCPRSRLLAGLGMITLALVCTWSRGPLVGAVLLLLGVWCLAKLGPRVFGSALITLVMASIVIRVAGLDAQVVTALKGVLGGSEEGAITIDYRSRLLDESIELIRQSPWFGVPNYAAYMQDLVQGEGIIDIVNAYLAVTLNTGLVGLACFLSPFVLTLIALLRRLGAAYTDITPEQKTFLRAFAAMITAILVSIFATSIYERIPYLMLLCVAAPGALFSFEPSFWKKSASLHQAMVVGGGLQAGHEFVEP